MLQIYILLKTCLLFPVFFLQKNPSLFCVVVSLLTNLPSCFSVQIHDQIGRVEFRGLPLGDLATLQCPALRGSGEWRPGARGAPGHAQRPGQPALPTGEAPDVSQRSLRANVRVLEARCVGPALLPWDPPLPPTKESGLLANVKKRGGGRSAANPAWHCSGSKKKADVWLLKKKRLKERKKEVI